LWLWRLAALGFPLLLLGLVETGLRLAGYGFSTDFFRKDQANGSEVLTDNPKFGRWFFPPALARASAPFSIPATKPPGTYRIFILGESAAMGDPESAFSFSRILEVLLREKYPETRFETVNTGVTAINSHAILPIARDCARQNGDLWVIYMGNNEVVGPYGAGTVFGAQVPPLPIIRASLALRATRTGQLLDAVRRHWSSGKPTAAWGGMQMFLAQQVPADDPRMPRVYANFEANLNSILNAGSRARVKQIVCTVGSNLKDCPPFASSHGTDLTGAKPGEWDQFYTNGTAAESAGRWSDALTNYTAAANLDAHYAELQFRMGHCLLETGGDAEAGRHFAQARDLDTLRFRADTKINQIIERTASGRTKDGIYFLDMATLLATNSPHGIPGEEMFYEHVHLTFPGNYLIARSVVEQVAQILPKNIAASGVTNDWLSAAECAQRLGWEDWSRSRVLAEVHLRLTEAPFTGQLDHSGRMARLEETLNQLSEARKPERLRESVAVYRQAIQWAPDDPVLHNRLAELLGELGDAPDAAAELQAVIRLLPHRSLTYDNLGMLYLQTGRGGEAEHLFMQALALDPESIGSLNGLGMSCINQRHYAEAAHYFRRALDLNPPLSVGLRINLCLALESDGKNAEAEQQYREVLRTDPENGLATINLGLLEVKEGKFTDAAAQLKKAVAMRPRAANAHLGLAIALEKLSDPAGALSEYQAVLQLDPNNSIAKRQVEALASRGNAP
jgi:tetratricopeptide (TPR) repeat protein